MIVAIGIMITGKLLLGYILANISSTLAHEESQKLAYELKLQEIKVWSVLQEVKTATSCERLCVSCPQNAMEDHKVEESLQKHVMEYHSYLWMRNRGMHIQDLLQDVPYCLRSDIFFFVAGDFLTHVTRCYCLSAYIYMIVPVNIVLI